MTKRMSSVADVLIHTSISRLANVGSYSRGRDYRERGLVTSLVDDDEMVTAKVQGTYEYRVKLWVEDGDIAYDCTCPVGDGGDFCKHCVAVALEVIDAHESGSHDEENSPTIGLDDIRVYLRSQDKDALVEMLIRQAKEDDRLLDQLRLKIAARPGGYLDLDTFRAVIDSAVNTGGFVDWRSAYDYSQGIHMVIDSLDDLLEDGRAAETLELAEYALAEVEKAMCSVDDSDGCTGEVLDRLQDLHLSACEQAKPDPGVLAANLFQWELGSDWGVMSGAADAYAHLLGEEGLAEYRKLIEAEWDRLPQVSPGEQDSGSSGRRYKITRMMEDMATRSGDIEALVAVKSRDLSRVHRFLEIARIYRQAGLHDKALEWAERGLRAFPERADLGLREFLAEEYHSRGRHDEAMAVIWAEYSENPSLRDYQLLKAHADRVGQWPEWRDKALVHLRHRLREGNQRTAKDRRFDGYPRDPSVLVRIFLWEGEVESAWLEAQQGGCSNDLWLELAAVREKDHPEDSLAIYEARVEPTIDLSNNQAYEDAIELLSKVRELMDRVGSSDEFDAYLKQIRTKWKRKRNLMKLLDGRKWD